MMRNVLVLGLGVSGQAVVRYLLEKGVAVTGVDRREISIPGIVVQKELDPIDFKQFDLVVLSPGIPLTYPHVEGAKKAGVEVIGEIELACRNLSQTVLAVTGTNGKTTVTLEAAHVLQQQGIKAKAVGNVGVPLITEINGNADVFVLELSSYQLETMEMPVIDCGIILNITPDHLDRYPNMEAYAAAKMRMEKLLKPGGILYVEEKCYAAYGHLLKTTPRTYGFSKDCTVRCDGKQLFVKEKIEYLLPSEYTGRGGHEVENLMAVLALAKECGVDKELFAESVSEFRKPPHRIEFVRVKDGVSYYDDSKGTNIDAVMRAVESLNGPIVLVAGGVDKGASYAPWINVFKGRVSAMCVIGEAAEKMAKELGSEISVEIFSSLEEAVRYAGKLARPGSNVLLSPGCSSFDMFRDYKQRGEEFKRVVNAL